MNIVKFFSFSLCFLCIACSPYKYLSENLLTIKDDFINYYILPGKQGKSGRDLIIYLDGSNKSSALGDKGSLSWKSVTAAFYLREATPSSTDILVPEFTNVRMGISYANDRRFFENYTLDGRVSAATMVIDHVLKQNHYQAIYIVGYSEGAQILPRVYRSLKSQAQISGLVLMSFGGMSQFEYFPLLYQKYGPVENTYLVNLKGYQDTFKRIQQNPLSIQDWWMGWPYRRWSSLGPYRPLEDLLLIDIPVLLTHGTNDMAAPVESSRLVVDEFHRAGKNNVTLLEYANNDHSYNGAFNPVIHDINNWISH